MEDDRSLPPFDACDPSLPPALEDEITRYTKRLCAGIRSRRARMAAEDELADHFRMAIYDMALCGVPAERALVEVAASFGDSAILRQQLAQVHNRLPPAFCATVVGWLIRALIALAVTLPMWGILTTNGQSFAWYHALPGVLILVGLRPLEYIRSLVHRGRFHHQIRRICQESGCTPLRIPSLWTALCGSTTASLYLLRIHTHMVAVQYRSMPRRKELRFADETTLLQIRRRRGIGLIDRRPGQFNLIRPAEIGDVSIRPVSYNYLLPPEWAMTAKKTGRAEQLMILEPYPVEVTYVKSTVVEEVTPGDRVFGFAVHTRKSALAHLLSLIQNVKEESCI